MEPNRRCIERDYTAELENIDDKITAEDEALVKKALSHMEYRHSLPHVVDIIAAWQFDETVKVCDRIAKEFSGRLKATVDYERYTAQIELECVYIDFDRGEFLEMLRDLAAMAREIQFQPLISGRLRVEITMPYFLTIKEKHATI